MTSGDQGNPHPKGIGKDRAIDAQRRRNTLGGHRQQPRCRTIEALRENAIKRVVLL